MDQPAPEGDEDDPKEGQRRHPAAAGPVEASSHHHCLPGRQQNYPERYHSVEDRGMHQPIGSNAKAEKAREYCRHQQRGQGEVGGAAGPHF
jgi:hypothetical protein